MARPSKYDWPDDEKLQALLDANGTMETARQLGCPPSSLSNRIRQRGLTGSKKRRRLKKRPKLNTAKPDGESIREPSEKSVRERVHAALERASRGNGSEPESVDTPSDERPGQIRLPLEGLRDGGHRIREKSEDPAAVEPMQEFRPVPLMIGAESPSPKRRRRRLRSLLRRVPSNLWRALAVVVLTALAGLAAFAVVRDDPTTYERESSFAIRPSETVGPDALPDVTGTLAQPDSAVTVSIVDILGSARLRSYAAQQAGLPADSVAESGAPYVWNASRRPGSTIIDVRLTGPSDAELLAMQAAASTEAARLVEGAYPLFRLEPLSVAASPKQVDPKTVQTVGLALLLGALLGITLVLLERKLRSSPGPETLDRGRYGRGS